MDKGKWDLTVNVVFWILVVIGMLVVGYAIGPLPRVDRVAWVALGAGGDDLEPRCWLPFVAGGRPSRPTPSPPRPTLEP